MKKGKGKAQAATRKRQPSQDECDGIGELVALEAIHVSLDGAMSHVHRRENEAMTFAAALCLTHVNCLIGWQPVCDSEFLHGVASTQASSEPGASRIDSWARASLPTKSRNVPRRALLRLPSPSTTSLESSRSSEKNKRRRHINAEPKFVVEETTEESSGFEAVISPRPAPAQPLVDQLELVCRRLDEEDDEYLSQIHSIQGKKWTTFDGKFVVVEHPFSGRDKRPTPSYIIKDDDVFSTGLTMTSAKDAVSSVSLPSDMLHEEVEIFKQQASHCEQEPIEDLMSLASGVTMTNGKGKSNGPPLAAEPNFRTDYKVSVALADNGMLLHEARSTNDVVHIVDNTDPNARRSKTKLKPLVREHDDNLLTPHITDAFANSRPFDRQPCVKLTNSTLEDTDENLRLIHSPDWGRAESKPKAKKTVVQGLRRRRKSSRCASVRLGTRIRHAAAKQTRKLESFRVPPPGLSEAGLALLKCRKRHAARLKNPSAFV